MAEGQDTFCSQTPFNSPEHRQADVIVCQPVTSSITYYFPSKESNKLHVSCRILIMLKQFQGLAAWQLPMSAGTGCCSAPYRRHSARHVTAHPASPCCGMHWLTFSEMNLFSDKIWLKEYEIQFFIFFLIILNKNGVFLLGAEQQLGAGTGFATLSCPRPWDGCPAHPGSIIAGQLGCCWCSSHSSLRFQRHCFLYN